MRQLIPTLKIGKRKRNSFELDERETLAIRERESSEMDVANRVVWRQEIKGRNKF
jgi:hypothetical protein